ncbi:MAG TPA: hypothetical protein VMT53_24330 [Terriglobales bacterium]|nr:hypothetical protein [Terriglobales bacterium]
MKARKWLLATAALAATLSTGAFADSPRWDRGRDRDDYAYTQQYQYRHEYRDGYHDRDRDHDRYTARNVRNHGRHDRDDR